MYQSAPVVRVQTQPVTPGNYRSKLLASLDDLPPLSTVLSRLLQMLNDEQCSSIQIASLIEKDSVLSGSVLRCVNSAYYGLAQPISSIRQAVTLLGFGTVRNLALAFSMKRMVRPQSGASSSYAKYSQHALACAVMTEFLAHHVRSDELDGAFAAGLFHDVGRLLILTTLPEVAPKVIAHWEQGDQSFAESEQAVLGVSHPELSGLVLEKWKLPEVVCRAAQFHESPAEYPSDDGGTADLARLVHAADLCVCHDGLAIHSSETRLHEPPDAAFASIGLADEMEGIREKFQAQFESIRSAFQN